MHTAHENARRDGRRLRIGLSELIFNSYGKNMPRIVITVIISIGIMLCIWGKYDSLGNQYLQAALTRSLTTFAAARAFNGVVSVAQQTEVNLTPMGIGLVLSPAQILDPLNDLVEQFSSVMLFSSAVLVGEVLVSELTGSHGFSNLTVIGCFLTLFLIWIPKTPIQFRQFAVKFSLVLILIRFLIPSYALLSEVIHKGYFANYLDSANAGVKGLSDQINEVSSSQAPSTSDTNIEKQGWADWLGKKLDEKAATIKSPIEIVHAKVDAYKKLAEDSVRHIVKLIALYILETAIFPILFFWVVLAGTRNIKGFFGAGTKLGN